MNRYRVQFKPQWAEGTASVYGIEAKTEAEALRLGAELLGLDTDPLTQTYTLALEAVQVFPATL
jgi:hypothetical protein